ncbi:ParA family protein [Vibrio vulnificus]|uniref:ParA family protein n=1 Tax=Vibrio vulnificus TaxID=672 RepID=UPI000500BA14|nr:ParA family protein [Vibrio vulnificus]ELJ8598087.1 ParA family protein [Vibrio cholerae]KFK52803.1 hypothetical protein JS86_23225 [Vibrio vulnificus]
MHIIFFNTKGGVSKSTLCEFSMMELKRLGYNVQVQNTDQQEHVTLMDSDNADYYLYDTAGSFTVANVELLNAAAGANAIIIIPMNTGVNDLKEVAFVVEQLEKFNVKDKARFVFTKTRPNSKLLREKKETLQGYGLNVLKWTMPHLEDFGEQRQTSRTRREISAFLHEVIL